jgi:UDP-N-acetylmuramate dehydrogenase
MVVSMLHELQYQVALANYTSWRIGGPAERLYLPSNIEDLSEFLKKLPINEPLTWLGLGSNTLIRDKGVRGTVIITQGRLNQLTIQEGNIVRAEAGVACPALARFSARLGLQGIEFLAGIPGTVGGALAMNAGCHGSETWNHIIAIETIDRAGQCYLRYPCDYAITYRQVKSERQEWFVAAHFGLAVGNKEASLEKIRALLAHRTTTQPTGEPNCGSVFRNPPGDYAARLIEACGLKGKRIGGASVSEKHANFIINEGTATAADVETLIEHVNAEVADKQGIQLIREVHIIGEK